MAGKHRLVIVGGGFAGIKSALELANNEHFEIKLISDGSNFEYLAALYRTVTGRSPKEVVLPISHITKHAKNIEFIADEIVKVNSEKKYVSGLGGEVYYYDSLIIAIGRVPNYYGIEGIKEESYSLDTVSKAVHLRKQLHDMVVKDTKESLSFVVVGGGASGTELAAELGSYVKQLSKAHKTKRKKVNVTLIEGSDRVLPILYKRTSRLAKKTLLRRGVKVYLNTHVTGYKDGVVTFGKNKLAAETIVWTAGSKNHPLFEKFSHIFNVAGNGKVVVNDYLEASNNIYVLGDNANTRFSGMAQTALYDARFISSNLRRVVNGHEPHKYKPRRPIYAVPIGGKRAIVQWGKFIISGYLGWVLRRSADLRLFHEFEPLKDAIKTWRAGNRKARLRSCEICES